MNSFDGSNSVLAKLSFQGGVSEEETEIVLSDPMTAELCKCHTISQDLTVAFHREFVCLYNGKLIL